MKKYSILTRLVVATMLVLVTAPLETRATNHDLGTFGGAKTISGTITSDDTISTLGIYLGGTGTYIHPQWLNASSTTYAHIYTFTAAASGTAYISSFTTSHSTGDGSVSIYAYATSTTEFYNLGTGALPVTKGASYYVRVYSARAWNQTFSFKLTAPGSSADGGSSDGDESDGYAATKAQTMMGAVYRDDNLVGTVTLKLGRADKNGVYKVSGSIMSLEGKRHTIRATSVARSSGAVTIRDIPVTGVGTMTLRLKANAFSGTKSNGLTFRKANVGSLPARTMEFSVSPYPTRINSVPVKTEYLPLEQKVSSNGKKLTVPKAGRITYRNGTFMVNVGGEGNLSGLRLTYRPRTGQVVGSFAVYTFNGQRLRKYQARVSGVAANGVARMVVTIARINFGKTLYATLK